MLRDGSRTSIRRFDIYFRSLGAYSEVLAFYSKEFIFGEFGKRYGNLNCWESFLEKGDFRGFL